MKWTIKQDEHLYTVELPDGWASGEPFQARVDGRAYQIEWRRETGFLHLTPLAAEPSVEASCRLRRASCERFPGQSAAEVSFEYVSFESPETQRFEGTAVIAVPGADQRAASEALSGATIRSPLTGKVLAVLVSEGQTVAKGQELFVIEAMKMENKIFATAAGQVSGLKAKPGTMISVGEVLAEIG